MKEPLPLNEVYHLETLLYDQVIGLRLVAYPMRYHRLVKTPLLETGHYHLPSSLLTVDRLVGTWYTKLRSALHQPLRALRATLGGGILIFVSSVKGREVAMVELSS